MEDGWWTLPLFMSCGCSGVPGRGCAGPHAAAAASDPGCARHGQEPLGPAGPSPAPRVGCIARLMRTFRPRGRGGPASSVRRRASTGVYVQVCRCDLELGATGTRRI